MARSKSLKESRLNLGEQSQMIKTDHSVYLLIKLKCIIKFDAKVGDDGLYIGLQGTWVRWYSTRTARAEHNDFSFVVVNT